jgi:hypothetical protein
VRADVGQVNILSERGLVLDEVFKERLAHVVENMAEL